MKIIATLLAVALSGCAGQAGMYLTAADTEITATKRLEAATVQRAACLGTNATALWEMTEIRQRGLRMLCLGEDLPSGVSLTIDQLRQLGVVPK